MFRCFALALVILSGATAWADDPFADTIAPFAKVYCVECHNQKEAHGDLDLTRYDSAAGVIEHYRHWNHVAEFIRGGEMPPEDAKQPRLSEREEVVAAIEEILLTEARKHAGDPGTVLPRRLSNTEYDLSVSDLIGVDIQVTADFPADPAAGEGFDNTGEALGMSPNLLQKYLAAADEVSNHMVLMPGGIRFAPFPVTSYNERKKLTELAIIDFYQQHDVRIEEYLEAAWRYRHRSEAETKLSPQQWADREGLSGKYLLLLWDTLSEAAESTGYLGEVGRRWNDIPPPNDNETRTPEELRELTKYIAECQEKLFDRKQNLIRPNAGTWPIAQLDMRAKEAAKRDQFDPARLEGEKLSAEEKASYEKFCHTFPNQFVYIHKDRGLAAGFHLVEGFFRDDLPLVNKVLNDDQRVELDRLWEELDFVTASTENLLRGFVWFERAERHVLHDDRFDFLRSEDPKLVEAEMLERFEKLYLAKLGIKLVDDTLEPESPSDKYDMIHGFYERVRHGLVKHRATMISAEQLALADLEVLASRAYRRPLTENETASLRSLYETLREQGNGVEASLRGLLTAILMSPDFCYRYRNAPTDDSKIQPLTGRELASRLSYLVWSSIPDDQLLTLAREGKLADEKVLREQTRRMLREPEVDAFAREFLGQWLRYRDYLDNDSISAEAFITYKEPLRQAMFEEPTRLATELIRTDQPLTRLLDSDVTYVNGVLARHYGGKIGTEYEHRRRAWSEEQKRGDHSPSIDSREVWHRIEGIREAGRGGLFGMGVILTKNSAGERTSPVKRGFWVVHLLLGKHFPPPPADVPELPASEKQAEKTIRELLAAHTVDAKCALCHVHFDSVGLSLEGFDPIGRRRTRDMAGREIDDRAELPGGSEAKGIDGLIDYVAEHRRDDFIRTLCRKFLGYALGRSVILSDEPLLRDMEQALAENDYRFSVLFETVVLSPQFRNRR